MPPETNPRAAFERLFGADANLDPATLRPPPACPLERARPGERAANPGVDGDPWHCPIAASWTRYLFAVREIEKRIQSAETEQQVKPDMEMPAGIPVTFAEYVKLMYDIQVVAFQTDLTGSIPDDRNCASERQHPDLWRNRHPRSASPFVASSRQQRVRLKKLIRINHFHVELFAYFLNKLDATQDGDGTLLDHSLIVYGSAIADGNNHTHYNLPVVLAGRGSGCVTPGRHIIYPEQTPMTNLYLTPLASRGRASGEDRRQYGQAGTLDRSGVSERRVKFNVTAAGPRSISFA